MENVSFFIALGAGVLWEPRLLWRQKILIKYQVWIARIGGAFIILLDIQFTGLWLLITVTP